MGQKMDKKKHNNNIEGKLNYLNTFYLSFVALQAKEKQAKK